MKYLDTKTGFIPPAPDKDNLYKFLTSLVLFKTRLELGAADTSKVQFFKLLTIVI